LIIAKASVKPVRQNLCERLVGSVRAVAP